MTLEIMPGTVWTVPRSRMLMLRRVLPKGPISMLIKLPATDEKRILFVSPETWRALIDCL